MFYKQSQFESLHAHVPCIDLMLSSFNMLFVHVLRIMCYLQLRERSVTWLSYLVQPEFIGYVNYL